MQSKSANTSSVQFEMLVNYMLKHPDLSKGYIKTPEARKKSAYLWTNLSKDLNAEGPPQRDGNGWKKVWADFKIHTKAKLRKNKTNLSGTGGGPPKYFHLTPLEEKVVELLDMGKAIDGLDSTNCFGMNKDKDEDAVVEEALQTILNDIEENVNDAITEENEQRLPRKVKPSLLETQVKNQIAFHNNAHEVLKEINDGIKGILRYKRKDFELKEKMYKLKKENFRFKKEKFDFKRENAIQKLKTNIAKLELKKEIIRLRQECENKQ